MLYSFIILILYFCVFYGSLPFSYRKHRIKSLTIEIDILSWYPYELLRPEKIHTIKRIEIDRCKGNIKNKIWNHLKTNFWNLFIFSREKLHVVRKSENNSTCLKLLLFCSFQLATWSQSRLKRRKSKTANLEVNRRQGLSNKYM